MFLRWNLAVFSVIPQARRNLLVAEPSRDEPEDLKLALGQPIRIGTLAVAALGTPRESAKRSRV
jgi:hypothetical protein